MRPRALDALAAQVESPLGPPRRTPQGRHVITTTHPQAAARDALRIGIDVGGTFTDLSLFDPVAGRLHHHKVLTTPRDPVEGIISGVQGLLSLAGRGPEALEGATIVHGTTLATNALIERRGGRVALLTTAGARDVLETGKENRYDPYDRLLVRPEPLVPRERRIEIEERVLPDGRVLTPLEEGEVEAALRRCVADGVETVAVCFLHSYANPGHEHAVRAIAERLELPLAVTLSSELAPLLGEFERVTTTVANAYVLRIVDRYLRALRAALGAIGHTGPFFLMWSDGGFASIEATLAAPLRLLESGPAAGALATCTIAQELGAGRVIAFDMGGTTAKMTLVKGGEAERTSTFEVGRVHRHRPGSGLTVRLPSIHMLEIGAGGGSIGHLDELGLLAVGPESAGAEPGPACYGLGGDRPTVTDANLVLGYLSAEARLAGDLRLRSELSREAMNSVGTMTGQSEVEVARRIRYVVTETMAQAVKLHVTEGGDDPAEFTLLAFGGAAPLHAYDVARTLGIRSLVFPLQAGVLSATGLLSARTGLELLQTFIAPLDGLDTSALHERFGALRSQALATLRSAGVADDDASFRHALDMRFRGQGYDIVVEVPADADPLTIDAAFRAAYRERYGLDVGADIEVRGCRIRAEGPAPTLPRDVLAPSRGAAVASRSRPVWFEEAGAFVDTPVHHVDAFPVGTPVAGPVVIEAPHTTFVIGPSGTVTLAPEGRFEVTIDLAATDSEAASTAAPVDLEILMARLRAVADEADRTLLRTAFSSVVRDGKDYSLVIADPSGTCLALPTECMPLFVTSMPRTLRLLAERFPSDTLEPGDLIVTNDPWLVAGHKSDVALMAPVFHGGRHVATIGTILHVADIGATLGDFRAWDIFEEGLMLPPLKMREGGADFAALMALIAANVRSPELVLGDIDAMRAAIRVATRRLQELLDGAPGLDLSVVAADIALRARHAFANALRAVPTGRYRATLVADGLPQDGEQGEPIRFALEVTASDDGLVLDFAGTDAQRPRQPINVPMSYTLADTVYTLQYLLAPHIPNVGPQFIPVEVRASKGCILDAQPPVPVFARTRTGLHVPTLISAALAEALPGEVQAGCGHNVIVNVSGYDASGRYLHLNTMPKGGMGATGNRDGWHCTAFPTNDTTTPIEVGETILPVVISKTLRPDSGGPGRARGGAGQSVTIRSVADYPLVLGFRPNFVQHPAPGLLGGKAGLPVRIEVNGRPYRENPVVLEPGAWCTILTAGGGGIGDPLTRVPARVAADVRAGVVSVAGALEEYGVVVDAEGRVDAAATEGLRRRRTTPADPVA
jgi:5-oxoprolinase (ATP-hydrolysing)